VDRARAKTKTKNAKGGVGVWSGTAQVLYVPSENFFRFYPFDNPSFYVIITLTQNAAA
jgi:hypothetical protein